MPFGGFFGRQPRSGGRERPGQPGHLRHHGVPGAHPDVPVRHVRQGADRVDHRRSSPTYAHAQVALQGAEEGTVLLKNNGILPLNPNGGKSVAVIGVDGSSGVQTIGGGSGTVTSAGTYTPLYSIQQRLAGTSDTVSYDDGTNQASAVALAQASSVAIVFASDNYGHEEADNTSLNLPNNQDALISAVAAANPNTIVVLNDNSAILMPWLNQVAGRVRGLLRRPGLGPGHRRAAVRRREPVRPPAGHVPDLAVARCPPAPPRSGRAPTARCSTPRASTSGTAGTTRTTSRRCSRSGSACPTPSFSYSNLHVGAHVRQRPGHGHRDRDQHRQPGRHGRGPAVRRGPGLGRRAAAPAQGLPADHAEPGQSRARSRSPSPPTTWRPGTPRRATGSPAPAPTRSWSATRRATCR